LQINFKLKRVHTKHKIHGQIAPKFIGFLSSKRGKKRNQSWLPLRGSQCCSSPSTIVRNHSEVRVSDMTDMAEMAEL